MKQSLGDKALFWGTVGSFVLTGIGFTAWLTNVSATATNVAMAQDKEKTEIGTKLDAQSAKLDDINIRLSRIEGALQSHK